MNSRRTPVNMLLPVSIREQLERTENNNSMGRTESRSEVAEGFLVWGFVEFKRDALNEGAKYLYHLRYNVLAPMPSRPEWLGVNTSEAKHCLLMLSWRTWRRLVNAVAESEQEGDFLSISDLFALYFAWGWKRFQAFTARELEEQEQTAILV